MISVNPVAAVYKLRNLIDIDRANSFTCIMIFLTVLLSIMVILSEGCESIMIFDVRDNARVDFS